MHMYEYTSKGKFVSVEAKKTYRGKTGISPFNLNFRRNPSSLTFKLTPAAFADLHIQK